LHLRFWRVRRLPFKLLFVYKEYLFDHALNSLVQHLRRNYRNIHFLAFTPEQRPRSNPGLSTEVFLRALNEVVPDVVFDYGLILTPAEVDAILARGAQVVASVPGIHSFFFSAPPMTQREALDVLRRHALYLVPHAPHVARLRREGVNAVEFPFWYDPQWFRPIRTEARFEILFVGDLHTPLNANRRELLERLSHHYDITIASARDPEIKLAHYLGHTSDPRQLNLWLNQACLVLGSDRLADTSALNSLPGQFIFYDDQFFIRQRTYLTLGAGACYLVERHPEIQRKFTDGEEVVLWGEFRELVEKARRLLGNSALRRRIGQKAHARALAEHSTPVRAQQLVALLEAVAAPAPTRDRGARKN